MKKIRKLFRRGLPTVVTVLLILSMILLCAAAEIIETKYALRADLSFNSLTSIGAATTEVLGKLRHPVHIYALYARGQEDVPLLSLLDRYAAASDRITWEQTDVALNPALLTRFRDPTGENEVVNDSVIVSCEETGLFRIISGAEFVSWGFSTEDGSLEANGLIYESRITTAIAYVDQETVPRVMYLQGHGELSAESADAFLALCDNASMDVYLFTMGTEPLKKGDLLVILSPVLDFSEQEVQMVADFIAEGGSVLMTCDYSDPVERMPNVSALLRYFGAEPLKGITVAASAEKTTYWDNNRICLLPEVCLAETTSGSSGTSFRLMLTGSRAFAEPGDTDRDLTVLPLLRSGSKAYLKDFSADASLEQRDTDATGPFALALESRRVTESGNVSRGVVLGCSTLLTSEEVYARTDAEVFIRRMLAFLTDGQMQQMDFMERSAVRPKLSAASSAPGSIVLVFLPSAVAAAAALIFWPRRRK